MKRWMICVATLLALTTSPLFAQTAVVGVSLDGAAPPAELISALEAQLAEREDVQTHDSALSRLSYAQVGEGEAWVSGLVSDLQKGVDAYFEFRPEDSDALLTKSIATASERPLLLTQHPQLSEALKQGSLIRVRLFRDKAEFDAADDIVRDVVERHPTWIPSRKLIEPATVELIEAQRGRLSALGKRLVFGLTSDAEGCGVNLNGDTLLLDSEIAIPVASRDYGIVLRCGSTEAGPFLLSTKRLEQRLPVGPSMIAALQPLEARQPPALPSKRRTQEDFGAVMQTLLGTESVLLVAQGGDGLWVARFDDAGLRIATTRTDTQEPARKLLTALDTLQPSTEVALDVDGLGFQRLEIEPPGHTLEYVLIGTGGAALLAGSALLIVAATSQTDTLDACKREACTDTEVTERAEAINTSTLTGHILLGVGGAVAATGLTLLLIDVLGEEQDSNLGFIITPDGAAATWTARW